MRDQFDREINYMRISITQNCNLKCMYCVSGDTSEHKRDVLSAEDIILVCTQAVKLGITNFKITGGEPLLRPDAAEIIKGIKQIPGVDSVTLTTNGVLLKDRLSELAAAGLDAVNVSLDTLKPDRYQKITGGNCFRKVIKSIRDSSQLLATKLNVVLLRGINEDEYLDFVSFGKEHQVDVRFIELMPIGEGRKECGVSNDSILEKLSQAYPEIRKAEKKNDTVKLSKTEPRNGPAIYYEIPDFQFKIGFISAIDHKFCKDCNRIRLTATGGLKGCLCYEKQENLYEILKNDEIGRKEKEETVYQVLQTVIYEKPKMHHFEAEKFITEHNNMREIGG